jgi:hypothetical protein
MMRQVQKLLIYVVVLLLAGCASTYVAPPAEGAARLRIAVAQSGFFSSVNINAYQSGQCESPMSLGMIGGIARHSPDKGLGIPDKDKFPVGTSIERLIPSGASYLVSLRGLYSMYKMCFITFKITPVKGEDYEANYSWDGTKCYVTLNKLTLSSTGEVVRNKPFNAEPTDVCSKGFN